MPSSMVRALLPWGAGRNFAVSGTGLLISGRGCITYTDAFETTGLATANVTIYDGTSANGNAMIDYALAAGQSTSEQWGLHWMPYYEGLYVVTNAGAAKGSISAWADHDCAYHVNTAFLAIEGALVSQALQDQGILG